MGGGVGGRGSSILRITRLFALDMADGAAGAWWVAVCRGRSHSLRRSALSSAQGSTPAHGVALSTMLSMVGSTPPVIVESSVLVAQAAFTAVLGNAS